MSKRVFQIDGNAFETLDDFFDEVGRNVLGGTPWGRNLDAFSDVLRGGFGTPDGGFVFRWLNSERSRSVLGYAATTRYLEEKIRRCHPSNVAFVRDDLEAARLSGWARNAASRTATRRSRVSASRPLIPSAPLSFFLSSGAMRSDDL